MPNTTQVNQRYTKRVNNTNVAGDTWTGQNVPGGGSVAASTVNNRGVIKKAGNLRDTAKWSAGTFVYNWSPIGVVVYLSDTSVIGPVNQLYTSRNVCFKANSSGQFATMTKGSYVIRRVTTTLASGISNSVLRTGASDFAIRRSIHKVESYRNSFMKGITFLQDRATIAEMTDGSTLLNDYTIVYSNQSSGHMGQNNTSTNPDNLGTGVDYAATPTLAVPGQLVYKAPALLPQLDLYKAKTQG